SPELRVRAAREDRSARGIVGAVHRTDRSGARLASQVCKRRGVIVSGLTIIEGPYLRDILDQPRALRETVVGLTADDTIDGLGRKLRDGEFERVVLTGM